MSFFNRLKTGLKKTNRAIAQVFTGAQIEEALYEELEAALLMSDAGVAATAYILNDLKKRVQGANAREAAQVRDLLVAVLRDLLLPLQGNLLDALWPQPPSAPHAPRGSFPKVLLVTGVNGAGKTTSIGKLTYHLTRNSHSVMLVAADTFRAAAREQLAAWSDQNQGAQSKVEIIWQAGADPSSVCFDAVRAATARGLETLIADTAGRLPTQTHLMAELSKIKRVITKAQSDAPHEVLLVIDGNTGQNALAQAKAFDAAIGLTGLIITKLDATAKGGILAAVALWVQELASLNKERVLPKVYFVGVGEAIEDLEAFDATQFATALIAQ